MDDTTKKMQVDGWSLTVWKHPGQPYDALYSKIIQTSKPGQPKKKQVVSGEGQGVTMAEAIAAAAKHALQRAAIYK